MNNYTLMFIAMFLLIWAMTRKKKRIIAAIIRHRKNHNHKENTKMKELAQNFIGKECLIYTISSDSDAQKGIIKEITENGILLEYNGNLQAINLEYVMRIREYPRKKNGKKKSIVID